MRPGRNAASAPPSHPTPLSRRSCRRTARDLQPDSRPGAGRAPGLRAGRAGPQQRRRLRAPGPRVGTRTVGGARRAGPGLPQPLSAPTSGPGDETAHCSRSPLAPPPWALLSVRLGHGWEVKNAGVQEPGSPPGLWPSAPGATGRPRLGGNTDRGCQAAALSWVPAARSRRGSRT